MMLKKYLGIILALFTLIVFSIFRNYPEFTEFLYTNGLYHLPRVIYRFSLFYLPFASFYFVFLILIFLIARHFHRKRRKTNRNGTFLFFLNTIGYLLVFFYFSWAMNYARPDFATRQNIEKAQPNYEFLLNELKRTDSLLYANRSAFFEIDTIAIPETLLPENLLSQIRKAQEKVLIGLGEPIYIAAKVRELRPKGVLLRLKTAGIYWPFSLEGNIDDGLHAIEKPFVMAHELAHVNAFTDEGVCNFIGFLTCINADDPLIRYSGWLEYHSYLYRNLRFNFNERFEKSGYVRPEFVIADIKAIIKRLDQYPNFLPRLRDLFYDNYLKTQGVHAGMVSYSQIIQWIYAFKKNERNELFELL